MNKIRNEYIIQTFGENLKRIRESKNLSQEQLANAADIPINQVGRIERGEINTTLSTIYALSTALEVPIQTFFI
jgi:transcriptional regulator with XRE-family HTH domain